MLLGACYMTAGLMSVVNCWLLLCTDTCKSWICLFVAILCVNFENYCVRVLLFIETCIKVEKCINKISGGQLFFSLFKVTIHEIVVVILYRPECWVLTTSEFKNAQAREINVPLGVQNKIGCTIVIYEHHWKLKNFKA